MLSLHKIAPPLKIATPQLHMLWSKPSLTTQKFRYKEKEGERGRGGGGEGRRDKYSAYKDLLVLHTSSSNGSLFPAPPSPPLGDITSFANFSSSVRKNCPSLVTPGGPNLPPPPPRSPAGSGSGCCLSDNPLRSERTLVNFCLQLSITSCYRGVLTA